ncbi:MAG: adenosylcobinamide-phosphate synthase CbiB [Ruminococcus sp.]
MHLIFGGYAQGRLSYALKTYHKNVADVFDCATQPLSEWNGQTILYHLEALVSQSLQQNKVPLTLLQETVPNWQDCILITQEVGCGLVPISAEDRKWREAVGRMNAQLAAKRKRSNGFSANFPWLRQEYNAMGGVVSSIHWVLLILFWRPVLRRIRWSGKGHPRRKTVAKWFPKHPAADGCCILAIGTVAQCWNFTAGAVALLSGFFWLWFAVHILCYQILAARCLATESKKVYRALQAEDLPLARKQLSWLVGRETQTLSAEEVTKACVETVAENTSDGEIAPLFYLFLGGVPLGFFYKAVNTLDSMVGYRNETYEYFGKAAAKLDDFWNWLPARISAWLMIATAVLLRLDGKQALQIYLRDRRKHLSPNSAQTESVAAGAMGIQLGGTHVYFGKVVEKPTIGDAIRHAQPTDILTANKLLFGSSLLFAGLVGSLLLWLSLR